MAIHIFAWLMMKAMLNLLAYLSLGELKELADVQCPNGSLSSLSTGGGNTLCNHSEA